MKCVTSLRNVILVSFWASTAALSETLDFPAWGVSLDVPTDWNGDFLDDSTYGVFNPENTVLYGVTSFSSLEPFDSDSAWVSGTMQAFTILLDAETAIIWRTDSLTPMDGLYTYRINYETFYQPTGDVLAGHSRFVAREGLAYEFFVLGDTLELYTNFSLYDSLLDRSTLSDASTASVSERERPVRLQRAGTHQWILAGLSSSVCAHAFRLNGGELGLREERQGEALRVTLSSAIKGPVLLRAGENHWLILAQ
ncbi:MAG TPA: hypothetical protein VLM37_05265 [Fibrobacteraceae bacterium]|nr:hypothetical protein [Fibrobacteraceae bacterium]